MSNDLEVIEPIKTSALSVITREEIDQQIATAHRFPRSLERFKENAMATVKFDKETAESCIYNRPVGQKGGRPIFAEGESIRLAEIVLAYYGNVRVATRIVEQTPTYVVTQGVAHDLESNVSVSCERREPTVYKNGDPYKESQANLIALASLAKSRRDVTFQVIPKALCKPLVAAAKEVINGGKSIEERRKAVGKWIESLNIDENRVWYALNIGGLADTTEKHLMTLTGLRTAIKEGSTTIDETFPKPKEELSPSELKVETEEMNNDLESEKE